MFRRGRDTRWFLLTLSPSSTRPSPGGVDEWSATRGRMARVATRPRSVSRSVPTSAGVVGNDGVRSQGPKPKGAPSPTEQPGEGKTGRTNESEPPLRSRLPLPTEMETDTGAMSQRASGAPFSLIRRDGQNAGAQRTPRLRDRGGVLPGRSSAMWNVETPMESGGGRYTGRRTVREAESSSGRRTPKKRRPARRKAPGTHNRLDRALPNPKGC